RYCLLLQSASKRSNSRAVGRAAIATHAMLLSILRQKQQVAKFLVCGCAGEKRARLPAARAGFSRARCRTAANLHSTRPMTPEKSPSPSLGECPPSALMSRDPPDESQTGINVRVFPALLQDRREVLTATSTSGNPNAWSRV